MYSSRQLREHTHKTVMVKQARAGGPTSGLSGGRRGRGGEGGGGGGGGGEGGGGGKEEAMKEKKEEEGNVRRITERMPHYE